MTRKLIIAAAAIAATLVFLGPGQQLVPGSLRLQAPDAARSAPQPAQASASTPAGHVAGGGAVGAPAVLPPSNVRVAVATSAAAKVEQGYMLDTEVRSLDGKPVNDATVRFYEIVDLLGRREMLIASSTTDGQGKASILYLPARPGTHELIVRFPGRDKLEPAVGRATFEAGVAARPYEVEPMPLSGFSRAVPYAVGAIVLTVWGLIAFALFGTARGVKAGARITRKGDTA